jgi:hypothetical protein
MARFGDVVSPRPELVELYIRRYITYKQLREHAIQFWLSRQPQLATRTIGPP